MARFPRKSDGRRIFTADFKREQIGRVLRGELTVAELSRRVGIAPSLLHRWKRSASGRPAAPDASGPYATPVNRLRTDQYIRELQRLVGKQTVALELLRAELDALKSRRLARGVSGR
jgi:transposase